jgi:hypothetical protein
LPSVQRTDSRARAEIEAIFPALKTTRWELRSPWSDDYNCHAWAAGDYAKRWEPTIDWYWPVPHQYGSDYFQYYTIDSFIEAFESIGYRRCNSPDYEVGFQKIAIYTQTYLGILDFPCHTARQRVFGRGWLSKLGHFEDIIHPALDNLNHGYGNPSTYMRRSWLSAMARRQTYDCGWQTFRFWTKRKIYLLRS